VTAVAGDYSGAASGQTAASASLTATGITFTEAVAEGETFEIEGRAIPVIGRDALLKNKRAAGLEQDIADVKALEGVGPR